MLLNNFSNILSAKLTTTGTSSDKVNYIKTTDGTIYENSIRTSEIYLYKVPTSGSTYPELSGIKLVLANDESEIPVNYYDYEIDNIDDQLTEIATTINKSNNYIVSKIVKNNTTNNISINTIGVIVHCYINNNNTFKDILIYKIKSDTPIIIEQGKTKTFTITIG